MPSIHPWRSCASAAALAATTAYAGQPLVTDDAGIVAPKTCQLEGTLRFARDGALTAAQPACNFGGNLEWSAGGAHVAPDTDPSYTHVQLQLKSALFKAADGKASFGASAGALRDTGAPHGSSAFQTYYGKAIASWYPGDTLEFDFNVGAANSRGDGTFALAGAAVQWTVVAGWQLLGEVFHDEPGRWKYQLGARSIVVPDRVELFASFGNRFGRSSATDFIVAGFRLQTPEFLR